MGTASLVLGILSIVFGIIGSSGLKFLGLVFGVIGIVLGVKAKNEDETDGGANAGYICSIIGTALSIVTFVACTACSGLLFASMSGM